MHPQDYFEPEFLLLIRRSMREGDVDAVVNALSQSSISKAENICIQFKSDLDQFQKSEIDSESWCLYQIRSFNEILNWPEFQISQNNETGELDRELLLKLVNSFELERALRQCEVLGDSSILMQARYMLFEKMFDKGLIEIETRELIRHSTLHQLWELGQSKKSPSNFLLNTLEVFKKRFYRLLR